MPYQVVVSDGIVDGVVAWCDERADADAEAASRQENAPGDTTFSIVADEEPAAEASTPAPQPEAVPESPEADPESAE